MAQNLTADCMLMPLPCGCCADAGSILVWEPEGQVILECPWCDATFSRDDVHEWLHSESSPQLYIQRPPRTLVRYAGKVLEALGRCDCDEPLVREAGTKQKLHLGELPESTPEVMRN